MEPFGGCITQKPNDGYRRHIDTIPTPGPFGERRSEPGSSWPEFGQTYELCAQIAFNA